MAEKLSRAWTADEAAEYRGSRGPESTGEAVPTDRTAEVSTGEDHSPGVESENASASDESRGDDPTPQEG